MSTEHSDPTRVQYPAPLAELLESVAGEPVTTLDVGRWAIHRADWPSAVKADSFCRYWSAWARGHIVHPRGAALEDWVEMGLATGVACTLPQADGEALVGWSLIRRWAQEDLSVCNFDGWFPDEDRLVEYSYRLTPPRRCQERLPDGF